MISDQIIKVLDIAQYLIQQAIRETPDSKELLYAQKMVDEAMEAILNFKESH